jgi:small subunit ribosomal protein S10
MHIAEQKKIRIRLRAYDHTILDTSCKKMIDVLKQEDNTQYSLVPLPTRRRIYCVLRSPHVNKDSREHFEIRTNPRFVYIYNPS